jgi:tripartite-type tricarboxylate transporter receptor subunit TctC
VPYRGGAPAMTDLMAGQVQVVFNPVPESMEFIKAGVDFAPAVSRFQTPANATF